MHSGHIYLLIVTCSQRKRSDPGLLPAFERYDGIFFRILRKALREGHWSDTLDVVIISAKYGLLELDTVIENYDLRMTVGQAKQLQPVVTPLLIKRVTASAYAEIFLNVGNIYYSPVVFCHCRRQRDTLRPYSILWVKGQMSHAASYCSPSSHRDRPCGDLSRSLLESVTISAFPALLDWSDRPGQ